MKNLLTILMISIYLLGNTGVVVSKHWCGGKVSQVSLFKKAKKSCACGKVKMPKGCCKNTTQKLSNSHEQLSVAEVNFEFNAQHFQPVDFLSASYNFARSYKFVINRPELLVVEQRRQARTPIYLFTHSLRI